MAPKYVASKQLSGPALKDIIIKASIIRFTTTQTDYTSST